MKENKLKYFYETLNNAVYPVQELYDNTVKNIPTMRFYEFMENQNNQPPPGYFQNQHPNAPPQGFSNNQFPPVDPQKHHSETIPIKKSDISFHSDDSYEDLPRKEVKIPKKPSNIPELCFDGLPEYETSSEEDNEQPQYQEATYQNGYDYINNFYKKVDQQYNANDHESHFELSIEADEKRNYKKSLAYSKSNQRSSSVDMKMSESF